MLSSSDLSFIRRYAYTCDHDYIYHSFMLGEPYLVEGCLCYFDGEHLTIEGSHLLRKKIDKTLFNAIVNGRPEFSLAKRIWYYGPTKVETNFLADREGVLYAHPHESDCDQFIELDNWSLESFPKARSKARRGIRGGITVESHLEDKVFTWEHSDLMRRFYREHEVQLADTMFSLGVRPLFAVPTVRLWNAYCEGVLVGFALLSELFPGHFTLLQSFFDCSYTGVADVIYQNLIEYSKAAGAKRLHLGHSVRSESLSLFKKKWGAIHQEAPYYFLGFFNPQDKRRDISRSFFSFWESLVEDQLIASAYRAIGSVRQLSMESASQDFREKPQ